MVVYKTELALKSDSSIQQILKKQRPKNKKLLEDFVEGTLPITDSPYKTNNSYDVGKYGDMLYFPTENDLKNYILATDYLVQNWDYEDSDIHDDTPEEINNLGNPALKNLDEILGFNSLRYNYLIKEYEEDITREIDGDYRTINLELSALGIITENGHILDYCHYIYDVTNWGDGFSTNFGLDDDKNHTYNVTLDAGEPQTFTIKVRATRISPTGDCTKCDLIKTWDVVVTITNPKIGCDDRNFSRDPHEKDFTYDGKNYRIKCRNGQRTSTNLLHWNEKIWAKTIFYKQKSNGKYRRRKPPGYLRTEIQGVYYTNECTTESDEFSDYNQGRRKSITVKKFIDNSFGTINIDGDPKQVTSNHIVNMGGDFISFDDFTIFP